jgi:hypothetical protein
MKPAIAPTTISTMMFQRMSTVDLPTGAAEVAGAWDLQSRTDWFPG